MSTRFWILAILFFLTLFALHIAFKDLRLPSGTVGTYYFLSVGVGGLVLLALFPQYMGVPNGVNQFYPSSWILLVIIFGLTAGVALQIGLIQTSFNSTNTSKIFLLLGAIPAVTNCIEELRKTKPDGMGIILSLAFASTAIALVVYYIIFRPKVTAT